MEIGKIIEIGEIEPMQVPLPAPRAPEPAAPPPPARPAPAKPRREAVPA